MESALYKFIIIIIIIIIIIFTSRMTHTKYYIMPATMAENSGSGENMTLNLYS